MHVCTDQQEQIFPPSGHQLPSSATSGTADALSFPSPDPEQWTDASVLPWPHPASCYWISGHNNLQPLFEAKEKLVLKLVLKILFYFFKIWPLLCSLFLPTKDQNAQNV